MISAIWALIRNFGARRKLSKWPFCLYRMLTFITHMKSYKITTISNINKKTDYMVRFDGFLMLAPKMT